MSPGTLKLDKMWSLPPYISKLVHPLWCQSQEIVQWILRVLTGSRSKEYSSVEMLKFETFGLHLRVLRMPGSCGVSFPVSVVIRGVILFVVMINTWCFLQEDGQMVPLVSSVPLWHLHSCVSYRWKAQWKHSELFLDNDEKV